MVENAEKTRYIGKNSAETYLTTVKIIFPFIANLYILNSFNI